METLEYQIKHRTNKKARKETQQQRKERGEGGKWGQKGKGESGRQLWEEEDTNPFAPRAAVQQSETLPTEVASFNPFEEEVSGEVNLNQLAVFVFVFVFRYLVVLALLLLTYVLLLACVDCFSRRLG